MSPETARPDTPLRVGYLLKMFPRLSETFILNEILELERQGVEVSVFSLMHPTDGRFHGRLADLRLTTEYVFRDKPESYWNTLRALPPDEVAPLSRWEEAADFLRRHSIPKDLDMLLRAVLIARRARQLGIQHLHAHFATVATRMAALVGMIADIPFSFTAHAKDIFRETVNRELFRELVDRSAFAITVSDFNHQYIRANTPGLDETKLIRLYNGIDLSFFAPTDTSDAPAIPHVVSIGRLVPKKGFAHLLQALRLCKDDGLRFRASIVGDGEELSRLQSLRDRLELREEVAFLGALPQEEVRRLLADATMMALACVPDQDGNMDALPTVLLEALALDLPIVSTTLTGIPEIVGDEAGVLVSPGDDRGLADAIASLWTSIRDGDRAAGIARARGERLFDLNKNVATLHDFYARSALAGALA